MGKVLDVDPTTVHRWEKGGAEPDGSAAQLRVAELYGVRAGWLMFGEPPMRPGTPAPRVEPVEDAPLSAADLAEALRRISASVEERSRALALLEQPACLTPTWTAEGLAQRVLGWRDMTAPRKQASRVSPIRAGR